MKTTNLSSKNHLQLGLNLVLAAALLFLFGYLFFWKNDKIAFVDSTKIMSEYKGAVKAKKEYDSKVKAWQSNIDTLTFDVQNAMKKYEKELAKMSTKERELARQLVNSKQKELSDYQSAIQENSRQEQGKLMQGIVVEVNAFLMNYGKDHNYKMILIANQSGTIAYAREGLDITKDVIDELNR